MSEIKVNKINPVSTNDIVETGSATSSSVVLLTNSSSGIDLDCSLSNCYEIGIGSTTATQEQNATLNNPTNAMAGYTGTIFIDVLTNFQTITFESNWKFPNGTVPELGAPGTQSRIDFVVDNSSNVHAQVTNTIS